MKTVIVEPRLSTKINEQLMYEFIDVFVRQAIEWNLGVAKSSVIYGSNVFLKINQNKSSASA